jgi:succinate dehydrogenase/fumarate reductase-like Fe-S protein
MRLSEVSSKTVTPLEHSKVKLDVSVEKDALRNEYTSFSPSTERKHTSRVSARGWFPSPFSR